MAKKCFRLNIVDVDCKNPSAGQLMDGVLGFGPVMFAYETSNENAVALGIKPKGLIAIEIDRLGRSSGFASAHVDGRHYLEPGTKPNVVEGEYTLVPVSGHLDLTRNDS